METSRDGEAESRLGLVGLDEFPRSASACRLRWLALLTLLALALPVLLEWPAERSDHEVRAQSEFIGYVWHEVWTLPESGIEPTPRAIRNDLEPVDLALSNDGRVFAIDAGSWLGLELGPEGSELAIISPDSPDVTNPRDCIAGTRLTSMAYDAGGPDGTRPDALHLIWNCMRSITIVHGQPRLRSARAILETRPDGRKSGRSVVDSLDQKALEQVALDPVTGQLIAPLGDALFWLRTDDGETVRRSFDVPVPLGQRAKSPGVYDPAQTRWPMVAHISSLDRSVGIHRVGDVQSEQLDLRGSRPLALATLPDGRIFVLVRPEDPPAAGQPDDPSQPLLRSFDAKGEPLRSWSADELGSPHPPSEYWPWQVAVSDAGFALTTLREGRFELAAFDQEGRERFRLQGGTWPANHDPLDGTGVETQIRGPVFKGMGLTLADDGRVVVLDLGAEVLRRLDRDGKEVARLASPASGIDLDAEDSVDYVSTADSRILALEPGADAREVQPEGYPPVHDRLSGRIAAGGGRLFAAWPARGRVAVLDPAARQHVASLALTDTLGLWPADLTADDGGRLYTANLIQGRIERWSTEITPTLEASLPAGFVHGPLRISWGRLADGREALAVLTLDGAVELRSTTDGRLLARFEPDRGDGLALEAEDIALDRAGRVLLAEVGTHRVHVFAPVGVLPTATPSPTPDPRATPSPTPERRCPMSGDKRVTGPERIVLGQTTEIQLTLRADCPPTSQLQGADIAIVVDRSGSMSGGNFEGVRQGVHALLQFVDTRYHRVALISFSDGASLDHGLTHDTAAIYPAVDRMQQAGSTVASGAIDLADEHLREAGREDALPIVILLSDGRFRDDPSSVAAEARGRGVQVYAVGYGSGIDRGNMLLVAGLPSRYREAPSPGALVQVYRGLISEVQQTIAGSLIIEDQMGTQIDLVPGSSAPPALELGGALKWGLPILPRGGITLTYRIRPRRVGIWPTNLWATADLRADGGIHEQFDFPIPEVEVIAPSPTPTATPSPTNTPSPTPTPAKLHLPLLLRERCLPGTLPNDVVLVLDSSTSMLETGADGRSKVEAARQAIRHFLSLLDLGPEGIDRAAIVDFNTDARLAQALTSDPLALDRALAAVTNASGTRVDLGIESARAELLGSSAREGAGRVVVLLTDGRANPVPIEVAELRATEAKAAGILIYSIGLGLEVETEALRRIASRPEGYFAAAGPEDLSTIYQRIALSLPCPSEAFWGRR